MVIFLDSAFSFLGPYLADTLPQLDERSAFRKELDVSSSQSPPSSSPLLPAAAAITSSSSLHQLIHHFLRRLPWEIVSQHVSGQPLSGCRRGEAQGWRLVQDGLLGPFGSQILLSHSLPFIGPVSVRRYTEVPSLVYLARRWSISKRLPCPPGD